MYLSKTDRRRIATIIQIITEELVMLHSRNVKASFDTEERKVDRINECHRATNGWLWELGCILMVPIKQVGDKETHIESRATPEEAPEEDDEATGS